MGVLSTLYDVPTLKAFLISATGSPLLSPVNSMICFYFDLSQTCSGETLGHLLNQQAITDVSSWSATEEQCDALLDGERVYLKNKASSVFSTAIASAASAGVPNFEIMVQTWVLRVGYYQLIETHAAFVAALNVISDWKTVKCDGTNLLYDSATIIKPDFLKTKDGDVLGALYPVDCSNDMCSLDDAAYCCLEPDFNDCCYENLFSLFPLCSTSGCQYYDFCCAFARGDVCCP